MEQGPEKRPDPEATGAFAGALTGFLADSDEEGGLSPELPIEEELVEKVMHELYEEITGQNDFAYVPAAPPPPPPQQQQQQPPASVEKNGKNGSCGASVSETASTVMAGVQFTCRAGGLSGPSGGEEGLGEAGEAGGGGDGVEIDDDEWLEKALSWVPLMEGLGGGL